LQNYDITIGRSLRDYWHGHFLVVGNRLLKWCQNRVENPRGERSEKIGSRTNDDPLLPFTKGRRRSCDNVSVGKGATKKKREAKCRAEQQPRRAEGGKEGSQGSWGFGKYIGENIPPQVPRKKRSVKLKKEGAHKQGRVMRHWQAHADRLEVTRKNGTKRYTPTLLKGCNAKNRSKHKQRGVLYI